MGDDLFLFETDVDSGVFVFEVHYYSDFHVLNETNDKAAAVFE